MAGKEEIGGPDLEKEGIAASDLADGDMVLGHVGDRSVIVARSGGEVFAIGGRCTHYGGPLGKGLFDGSLVRCPWHHAAFDVRTGEAVRPPALNPVPAYVVTERDGRVYVTGEMDAASVPPPIAEPPASVVILGAGVAGGTAAETLRTEGFQGPITLVGSDPAGPVDRPNLSKDYLAGEAPAEWIPLRSHDFYTERGIELMLGRTASAIEPDRKVVILDDGTELTYGALLIATGADPVHLDLPGSELPHVHYLRSLANAEAIAAGAEGAQTAVVIGASFIGLEVAASLRHRGLAVHVAAPEAVPMARILGEDLGRFVLALHEEHGVQFHLGTTAVSIDQAGVLLSDGTGLPADLVVIGVGVRPATALAEQAGLEVDRGIVVDSYLATSDPAVWAAGDVASYPDPRLGHHIRVEHFVVAERQGQAAARNMLGRGIPFRDVPFFWSQHYDVQLNYVGHAEAWDEAEVVGSIEDRDATVLLKSQGTTQAVVTLWRDRASLAAEVAMENDDEATLAELPPA